MNSVAWKTALIGIILLATISFIPVSGLADSYAGGILLETNQTGLVSGGLYVNATSAPNWGDQDVTKEFTIPNYTSIQWARLYVTVYVGHMENNYRGTATISMDYTGDGNYDGTPWSEDLDVANLMPMNGGDMSVTVNDHCNRVTSDYLMWYDVTSLINKTNLKVNVLTEDVDASFDGRIKVITLAVAYNDSSNKTVRYWVNEGHDAASYYYRDGEQREYLGETTFEDVPSGWSKANLTVNHMASADGFYWFNGTSVAPTWNGTCLVQFGGNLAQDPATGNQQGSYSGYNLWNVTSVLKEDDNILYYSRNHTADGVGGHPWYKIPLAFLEVTY